MPGIIPKGTSKGPGSWMAGRGTNGRAMVVRAEALDWLAWTYCNIPAIGEVILAHSTVDVGRGEGEAKWSLGEDAAGSKPFTCEPVTEGRTVSCSP